MTAVRVFLHRLLGRFRRDRWEAELDDELRFHLQMEIERQQASGLTPDEARRQAFRAIGGIDVTKEEFRDQKSLPFIELLLQDARYAGRMLLKYRGFSVVAILTLALGIGANTAIFSVVNGVLLDPLPYEGSERIVTVWEDFSAQDGPEQEWVEIPNFNEWKVETDLFETMVVYGGGPANLTGRGAPQRLNQLVASHDFLKTFAVAPALGRDLLPEDEQLGAPAVVLLSHGFWQGEFAGDAGVVGQTIQLNGQPTVIIGVMRIDFDVPVVPGVDLLTAARLDPARDTRNNFSWMGLARLQPDVSVEQAEGRLNVLMAAIGEQFPENRGVTVSLVPLLDQLVGPVRASLYVLQGIVMLVLLIACANIANLMLSRGATRIREMAVRMALGAGRGRLVRQLLTESLVLSLCGAALGVLLAWWGTAALVAAVPPQSAPRLENVSIDGTVLFFTLVLSGIAGLLFGLAPVAQSSRHNVGPALKEGGRQSQESGASGRIRGALAACQVALALCLLIAAGLTTRSFVSLMEVDPGFEPEGLTTALVTMPPDAFEGGPELVDFMDRLMARIEARADIESVAAVSVLPLSGFDSDTSFEIEGRADLNVPGRQPVVWFRRVTPAYFETMGVALVRGREFTDRDTDNAPPVVMVSEVAADRYWPGQDALGQRVRFGGDWHTVVGVAAAVKSAGLSQEAKAELYFPFAQRAGRVMTLVVKSSATEATVAQMLRSDLAELAPDLPLSSVMSMSALMSSSTAQPRFLMNLTAAFGLLALTLAAIGIYGVMAYSVSRRRNEIGLRMALGAGRRRVLGMVVSHGLKLTAVGLAVGLLFAWWSVTAMSAVLFDIEGRDLATFATAPLVLGLVAVVACLVPAIKATRIDPMRALRED